MRRAAGVAVCLFLFLWCGCTQSLASRTDELLPRATSTSSGEYSSASETEDSEGAFPFEQFVKMFNTLAGEVGLPTVGPDAHLRKALERLFRGVANHPEIQAKPAQLHGGLLRKMLAAKMERQNAGKVFDEDTFFKEFSSALGQLKNFRAEKTASPASAIQRLSQLTDSLVRPEDTSNLQSHLEQAAKLLKQLLPGLSADEEL